MSSLSRVDRSKHHTIAQPPVSLEDAASAAPNLVRLREAAVRFRTLGRSSQVPSSCRSSCRSLPVHRAIGAVAAPVIRHDRVVTQPIVQVDAFTAVPFAGSPAAVCILPAARDAGWMQHVAREMNLSETAFLVPRRRGGRRLRAALVHADRRSGSVRACDARQRARALGDRPARRRRDRAVSHAQRPADRGAQGRLDRARLSVDARGTDRRAGGTRRRGRRRAAATSAGAGSTFCSSSPTRRRCAACAPTSAGCARSPREA